MEYITNGVCAKKIILEIDNGIIKDIQFIGGCNGNLKAIIALCKGQDALKISAALKDIKCGSKQTSCPDQLSKAILSSLT